MAEMVPAEVYDIEIPLGEDLYSVGPLNEWIERQQVRVAASGMTWTEWCGRVGIGDWARKKLARETEHGGKISYVFIERFLVPAGLMVEDLYGWERP